VTRNLVPSTGDLSSPYGPLVASVTVQTYSVDNDTEAHVMTVNLVDHKVSLAARRLAFLVGPSGL